MYQAERGITFKLCINDYTHSVKIVYLVKALVLIIHLAIYAVSRLYSSLCLKMYFVLTKSFLNLTRNLFDKIGVLAVFLLNIALHLGISNWVKVGNTQIFKLLLYFLYTETVGKRRVNVHSFKSCRASFGVGLYRKRAHIVKSVAKLDEYNSDVL